MNTHLPPVEYVMHIPKTTCYHSTPLSHDGYTQPAEFEEQKALWLVWSWGCAKQGYPYTQVIIDILKAIYPNNNVVIIYNQTLDLKEIQKEILSAVGQLDNMHFYPIANETIWLRDTGPTFVKTKYNRTELIQFEFNDWGYIEQNEALPNADNQIPQEMAKILKLKLNSFNYVSEGGNRETNGKGVLIAVSDVETKRNPHVSLRELEECFHEALGIKKTIWLPSGLCEDAITMEMAFLDEENNHTLFTPFTPGGHIDEFCRFADENTILLAEVVKTGRKLHSIEIENDRILETCYDILCKATNSEGSPFNIIRVPTPPLLINEFCEEDPFYDFFATYTFPLTHSFPMGVFPKQKAYSIIVSASYLNFVKMNDTILLPSYWQESWSDEFKKLDDCAYEIFKRVFPNLKIVQIDTYNVNLAGGGIHCMTLNEPR